MTCAHPEQIADTRGPLPAGYAALKLLDLAMIYLVEDCYKEALKKVRQYPRDKYPGLARTLVRCWCISMRRDA